MTIQQSNFKQSGKDGISFRDGVREGYHTFCGSQEINRVKISSILRQEVEAHVHVSLRYCDLNYFLKLNFDSYNSAFRGNESTLEVV